MGVPETWKTYMPGVQTQTLGLGLEDSPSSCAGYCLYTRPLSERKRHRKIKVLYVDLEKVRTTNEFPPFPVFTLFSLSGSDPIQML